MTVGVRASGTPTAQNANVNNIQPAVPAGWVAGDLSILYVQVKPDTTTIATPAGWTKIGESSGGVGVVGVDTGPVKVAEYHRTDSPTLASALTLSGASAACAVIHIFTKTLAEWDLPPLRTSGSDTSHGANMAVTAADNLLMTGGDQLVGNLAMPNDVGPTNASMSVPGLTMEALTTAASVRSVTTGNDLFAGIYRRLATAAPGSETSTGPPAYSGTSLTDNSGHMSFLRLRDKAASSGTNHTESAVNDVGLADSSQASQTHNRVVADGAGLAEKPTVSQAHTSAVSDATGLSDTAAVALFRSIPIDVADSIGSSDVASLTMELVATVKDSSGLSDAVQMQQGHGRSTADLTGLSDSAVVSRGLAAISADPVGIADVVALAQRHDVAVVEGSGLSDAATVSLAAVTALLVQDLTGLSDSATVQLFAESVDLAEAVGIADSVALAMAHALPVADAAGLMDVVSLAMQFPIDVGESTGLAETVSVALVIPLAASVLEPVGLTDTVTVTLRGSIEPALEPQAEWGSEYDTSASPQMSGSSAVATMGSGSATLERTSSTAHIEE